LGIIIDMLNEKLGTELIAMREEDFRVRQELLDAGLLGGPYVPRMEAVHVKNAARLRQIIAEHGWPAEDIVGKEGAEAAWIIAQHAVGEPDFQRRVLRLLQECAAGGAFLPGMPHTWRIALRCMKAVPSAMARNGWTTHKTAAFGHGHSLIRITSTNSEPRSDSIRYAPFPTSGRRFHKNNKKPSRRPPDGGTNGWPAKDGLGNRATRSIRL
jgi:hypothetical protein